MGANPIFFSDALSFKSGQVLLKVSSSLAFLFSGSLISSMSIVCTLSEASSFDNLSLSSRLTFSESGSEHLVSSVSSATVFRPFSPVASTLASLSFSSARSFSFSSLFLKLYEQSTLLNIIIHYYKQLIISVICMHAHLQLTTHRFLGIYMLACTGPPPPARGETKISTKIRKKGRI